MEPALVALVVCLLIFAGVVVALAARTPDRSWKPRKSSGFYSDGSCGWPWWTGGDAGGGRCTRATTAGHATTGTLGAVGGVAAASTGVVPGVAGATAGPGVAGAGTADADGRRPPVGRQAMCIQR